MQFHKISIIRYSATNYSTQIPLWFAALLSMLFVLLHCSSAAKKDTHQTSTEEWVIGEGTAMIYQNDKALARDRALRDAKKDAVRRKLGTMIQAKTITESGVWVKGEVTARSEGLVRQHEIISEQTSGEMVTLKIKAQITEAALRDMVNQLLDEWERPIIFTMVSESFEGSPEADVYDNTTIQNFSEYFLQKGFTINKTSAAQKSIKLPPNMAQLADLGAKDALDFDLMLYGSTVCKNAGPVMAGSKLLSAQVDVKLSLYDVNTRAIVATVAQHAAYPHINFTTGCIEGIKKAGATYNQQLFDQMLSKWSREYSSGRNIILEISGSITYRQFYELQIEMKELLRGVVDVIEKGYGNKSTLVIVFQGKTADLLQELMNKKFSTVNLTVSSRQGNKILLQVR